MYSVQSCSYSIYAPNTIILLIFSVSILYTDEETVFLSIFGLFLITRKETVEEIEKRFD